mgnify:CR=1 FL=1|tara:strand:- start:53 stop:643 length:591 start_codon:yes stop_codon:yes gene_type:complete
MDHLYGDGTAWDFKQYQDFLVNNNNIYNLHNTLLQITNHIFDGGAEIVSSWKNIAKMSSQNDNNTRNWVKDEVKNVKILETSIGQYKKLLKEYLFKIDKLLSENPEIIKVQEQNKINQAQKNTLKELENQEREKLLETSNKFQDEEDIKKIIKVVLQVFTIFVGLIIIFLINSKTRFLHSFSRSIMSVKRSLSLRR